MKVALFGAAGQVGTDCVNTLRQTSYDVLALTRKDADFSRPHQVASLLAQLKPDIVVNACAYTAVDRAEEESELADLVNHHSVLAMAKVCSQASIPLVHLSTDYVFDGTATQPYQENSLVQPLGVYGKTKLAGELAVRQSMEHYIILRTSWVFGENGRNFVKTMLRVGQQRDQLKVVDDQIGRPSYVGDIVSVIQRFLDTYQQDGRLPWGVYHCSSEGELSWYEFAKAIFEEASSTGVLQKQPKVLPIPSAEYPTPAPRPAYSVLATEKLTEFMGMPLPSWRQGLQTFMNNIKALQ